ncbi:hypothetical protein CAPTEDRAFT_219371 [Capitella teleta]|uniref:PHD-type domain-containing protein n=1 Tax=Capitella teleta TaxID=283909 RepID=R7TGD5_CAPTE|nr:hypothetical protein CAPTEDRAFT_219371 [Capitella teleta]|eukprot:ELT92557.1 hypothetical protein CAPTEDRAFT_219371 [Capitella teleta]
MASSVTCGFCQRGREAQNICGKLWKNTSKKGDVVAAHHKCMQYSSGLAQYLSYPEFGGFKVKEVRKEIERGRGLKCNLCKGQKDKAMLRGATSGCAIKKCSQKFHFYCATQNSKAFTKRMEITDHEGDNVVCYRVYCSEKHLQQDEAQMKKDRTKYRYASDSEGYSLSEEESEDDDISPPMPKRFKKGEESLTNGHSAGDQMKPCVLCFVECQAIHPNTKIAVDAMAAELYEAPSDSVLLWQNERFPFLLPRHMIALFKAVSSAIRDKRFGDLSHLLFSLTEEDAESFEKSDSQRNLLDERKEVQENFVAAKENIDNSEVGRLKKMKDLRTWVMFVVLNSALDPTGKLRQELLRHHCLFRWSETSLLKSSFEGLAISSEDSRETELHTLQTYLTELAPSMRIERFPSDAFLLSSNPLSVTELLVTHFEPLQDCSSDTLIAFIGPVESKLLDHRGLVVSCMQWLVEEYVVKTNSRVLCVFDVGVQYDMIRAVDMLCELPEGVDVQILSSLNPETDPVTCLLVDLTWKSN